jgi:hypothetical protein
MAEQQDHSSGGEDAVLSGSGEGTIPVPLPLQQTNRAKKITYPSGALPKKWISPTVAIYECFIGSCKSGKD